MAHATRQLSGQTETPCSARVDRVVAQIDGALGSSVLVGLDRLVVCRCDGPGPSVSAPRAPFLFSDLEGASIVHYGTVPVLVLTLVGRPDPLPVLLFERHQIGLALDGLVVLRRLISASRAEVARAKPAVFPLPTQPRPVRITR